MNIKTLSNNLTNWLFGIIFILIGIINLFWGNDPFFGIFILLLSLIYLPPTISIIKKEINFSIPFLLKFIVGVFILWSAIGVGELFNKIEMMRQFFF